MRIVIFGLSITSSWGNGHATTYRGLMRELVSRGHDVLFLERDVPWYAMNRDLPRPPYGRTELYADCDELRDRFAQEIRGAEVVMVGSYVPNGVKVGNRVLRDARGVRVFYDIDTPVTLNKMRNGDYEYLRPEQVSRYDLYLSFTGGPVLDTLEREFGARMARPLYCSVDSQVYYPEARASEYDLGYMGTFSFDRQPPLDELMLKTALRWRDGRFIVAGPLYPETVRWPGNVARVEHLPPSEHRKFYTSQRFTLNVTRAEMSRAGYSPSVRLFEAAACATPIVSDSWAGLGEFFRPGTDILISHSAEETLGCLRLPEERRIEIGERARRRVLAAHTAAHRAEEFERYVLDAIERKATAIDKHR